MPADINKSMETNEPNLAQSKNSLGSVEKSEESPIIEPHSADEPDPSKTNEHAMIVGAAPIQEVQVAYFSQT
jgi:hypothetical protein